MDATNLCKYNEIIFDKSRSEELDEKSQKRSWRIVGKFLYYSRSIELTMLMTLNSLAVVQKKKKIETAKQITQF